MRLVLSEVGEHQHQATRIIRSEVVEKTGSTNTQAELQLVCGCYACDVQIVLPCNKLERLA